MRILLALLAAFCLFALPAQAQIAVPTVPHDSLGFAYDSDAFGINPISDLEAWSMTKRWVVGDIILTGYIDTTKAVWNSDSSKYGATYHGRPIPLWNVDSIASKIDYGGYDSVTITSYYRFIKKAANQWYASQWIVWNATGPTFTNHVNKGNGMPDTLISIAGVHPNIDWTNAQYIQFKHKIISNKALRGTGTKATKEQNTGKNQPFWRGQALITLVRGDD